MGATTANTSTFTAVSAVAVTSPASPERTSIRYCSAAPTAPPPGTTLAIALLDSCALTTGDHARTRSVSRCSAHRHALAAACSTSMAASHAGEMSFRSFADPAVAITLGATR